MELPWFASQFLSERDVAEYQGIVKSLLEFELCHGRPRFLAFILDEFMRSKSKDIESAKIEFFNGLYEIESHIFPLQFLKKRVQRGKVEIARDSALFGKFTRGGKVFRGTNFGNSQ